MRWQDGRVYKGRVKDGRQDGLGFVVGVDGKLTMGEFQGGKLIKELNGDDYSHLNYG